MGNFSRNTSPSLASQCRLFPWFPFLNTMKFTRVHNNGLKHDRPSSSLKGAPFQNVEDNPVLFGKQMPA